MDFNTLKSKSKIKILLRGKSSRGKTYTACKTTLELLNNGANVIYVDTEAEGSATLVNVIESEGYSQDVVENLEYVKVDNYSMLMETIERQDECDVMVVDTLDHKHSFALKNVTDAKIESDADWNEYAQIYSAEKQVMEELGKPDCNIIATLDPDSGKMGKPKGAQTNVHGYFSVVVDMKKSGDEWTNKITNWVGKGHVIGASADNLIEALSGEIEERIE